jgi:hypothetical protein
MIKRMKYLFMAIGVLMVLYILEQDDLKINPKNPFSFILPKVLSVRHLEKFEK